MPAPRDTDTGGPKRRARRPRRTKRSEPYSPPKSFRTEQATPAPRPAPKKGPPSPQSTGRATRPQPVPRAPRPSGPKGFEPFRGGSPDRLERQQAQQRKRTRRARSKLPADPRIPHVPVLRHYTPRQKQIIHRAYDQAVERTGVRSQRELYKLGNQQQRRNMRDVTIAMMGGLGNIERIQERNRRDTVAPGPKPTSLPKKAAQAGLIFTDPDRLARTVGLTGINVARATVESPGRVGKASLRTAIESVAGIPQGIKQLADDPVKAVEMIVDDYEHRYGDVLKDPEAFRERVKDEWGLTPYVLDAAAAAGGGGQVLGAAAR